MKRVLLLAVSCLSTQAAAQVPWLNEARNICANRLGANPAHLVDTYSAQGDLPTTGVTLYTHKFAHADTADLCSADMDVNGNEVDGKILIAQEAAARWTLYGALKPEQHAALSELPPDTVVPTVVWLVRPPNVPNFEADPNPFLAKRSYAINYMQKFANLLRAAYPYSNAAPIDAAFAVTAQLKVAHVLDVARWSDVADVTTSDVGALLAPAWYGTHRFDLAHNVTTGSASSVGVIEFGQWSALATLPAITVLQNGQAPGVTSTWHLQSVISVLSNTAGPSVQPGASPQAPIKYAGASSLFGVAFSSQKTAADLLIQNPVDVINMSFYNGLPAGSAPPLHTPNPEAFGNYCDEQAYDLGVTFAAGAGNEALLGGSYEQVASPANGLNVIGVGMFNDNRTTTWEDDAVSPASSWRDPPGVYGDRIKPDVVASGDPVFLVDSSSGSGIGLLSGTSFATPMASGTIALMNHVWRTKWGFTTAMPPEMARAFLAATALNNVDRVLSSKPGWPPHVHTSARDGSGGIDANAAVDSVNRGRFDLRINWGGCAAPQSRMLLRWFPVTQGKVLRMAMAYSSEATALGTPTADLDLLIGRLDPVSRQVLRLEAWSPRIETNVEMVEFPVQTTGIYGIILGTRSCQKMPKKIAFAWWISP